jgi:hypothetical protein
MLINNQPEELLALQFCEQHMTEEFLEEDFQGRKGRQVAPAMDSIADENEHGCLIRSVDKPWELCVPSSVTPGGCPGSHNRATSWFVHGLIRIRGRIRV